MSDGKATRYEPIAVSSESTVVAEFIPEPDRVGVPVRGGSRGGVHQSCCSRRLTTTFRSRPRHNSSPTSARRSKPLNGITFSDAEWDGSSHERIAGAADGHRREDRPHPGGPRPAPQARRRHDQEHPLIDKSERPQQSAAGHQPVRDRPGRGWCQHANRYDVTVLVNGLPLVHIELKRRGVDIREAFNQIDRYQRDSFWAGSGLFDYVQLFVISNGTLTKYYSNTTRRQHLSETTSVVGEPAGPRTRSSSPLGGRTPETNRFRTSPASPRRFLQSTRCSAF